MIHKLARNIKKGVTLLDLFSTGQLLRYRDEPEYQSAVGGICSIAVLIGFAIIFTNTILSTIEKQIIVASIT